MHRQSKCERWGDCNYAVLRQSKLITGQVYARPAAKVPSALEERPLRSAIESIYASPADD
jgi:hypothetical protein